MKTAVMTVDPVLDLEALRDFHVVESAALAHDRFALPADPFDEYVPLLDGQPRAGELCLFFVGRVDNTPVSCLTLRLTTLDNLNSLTVAANVHPDHRRRGFGRALVQHAIEQTRQLGRDRVFFEVPHNADDSNGPAVGLMRELGAKPVLDDFRRVLDLHAHPPGSAPEMPAGYRIQQWCGATPTKLLDGVAYLNGRMVLDAPMGDMDYDQEAWDADRVRAKDDAVRERGRVMVSTAALHEESGQLAGITEIAVSAAEPEVSYQWETIVDPVHRGHGLGLVIKSWNHRLLVEQVPEVQYVNTWNAGSNSFMIAVNERLGFEVAERWTEYQLDL
jgi:GNAT superfamily N-acetyltransferase